MDVCIYFEIAVTVRLTDRRRDVLFFRRIVRRDKTRSGKNKLN